MQQNVEKLQAAVGNGTLIGNAAKAHVQKLDGQQLNALAELGKTADVELKRSGTGITIIVK